MSSQTSDQSSAGARPEERAKAQSRKYLLFKLGNDLLCSPLADVKEIIGVPEATPLPGAAQHVRGFINLRGRIISLIDLSKRLGNRVPAPSAGHRPCTIIVENEETTTGFIVDDVSEVLRVDEAQIDRDAKRGDSQMNHIVTGVVKLKDRPLALLIDLPRLAYETVGGEHRARS